MINHQSPNVGDRQSTTTDHHHRSSTARSSITVVDRSSIVDRRLATIDQRTSTILDAPSFFCSPVPPLLHRALARPTVRSSQTPVPLARPLAWAFASPTTGSPAYTTPPARAPARPLTHPPTRPPVPARPLALPIPARTAGLSARPFRARSLRAVCFPERISARPWGDGKGSARPLDPLTQRVHPPPSRPGARLPARPAACTQDRLPARPRPRQPARMHARPTALLHPQPTSPRDQTPARPLSRSPSPTAPLAPTPARPPPPPRSPARSTPPPRGPAPMLARSPLIPRARARNVAGWCDISELDALSRG